MDARLTFDGDLLRPETTTWGRPELEKPQLKPTSGRWNSHPDSEKWLVHNCRSTDGAAQQYRIQGWLARTGTSVWFGAGSTGKTQLMLWMAAMIASLPEDRLEDTWLGGQVHGTGHVLILTAEDTRDQIVGRLRDVVRHSMRQSEDAQTRTFARIHIMPFLSMREGEFDHPNPSLFEQAPADRQWSSTAVMQEVRRYVMEWNRTHEADDRIVGVVMDSATSMSGFDSLDAPATTNFFFYLGRLCERLGIFWAIIGHTPKTTTMNYKTYRATAPSRLRGVAMWTTAPRLTVEVRLSQTWRIGKRSVQEAAEHLAWLPAGWSAENLLVVYVAKANLKHVCRSERILARQRHGAFVDVTEMPAEALLNGSLEGWSDTVTTPVPEFIDASMDAAEAERITRKQGAPRSSGRPRRDPAVYSVGTDLVAELVAEAYPAGTIEQRVSANRLSKLLAPRRPGEVRSKFITSASGGRQKPARIGSINWHLDQLVGIGILRKDDRGWSRPASVSRD